MVVLVERVELILLFLNVEFRWRDILEVCAADHVLWVVARLQAKSSLLNPAEVPDRAGRRESDHLVSRLIECRRNDETIDRQSELNPHEEVVRVRWSKLFVTVLAALVPTVKD